MPEFTPEQYARRDERLLRLTAGHRVLLARCAAAALADHKPLTHALNRLTDSGALVRYERVLPGGLTAYTVSPSTATRLGLPRERAELPTGAALDTAVAIQVFAHLGRHPRFRLSANEVAALLNSAAPTNVPYLLSSELGAAALFRTLLVANRDPAEATRYVRTLTEQATRHPQLCHWIAARQLGFALLASTRQQVAALEKGLVRSGLTARVALIVDVGPDAEHLAAFLKSASERRS